MTWPDRVSVFHKLRSLPSDSTDAFQLDVMILSERHQRPAARCAEDIVVYDYRQGQKIPLPGFMRSVFAQIYEEQEQAGRECRERVEALISRILALERKSWNREAALEDLGSSRT